MVKDSKEGTTGASLDLRLGTLPPETVDAMFAGLSWEAERTHGLAVRAVVASTFASAKVEADIMSDESVSARDRLKAAQQFKEGFLGACRLVMTADTRSTMTVRSVSDDNSVPAALEQLYGAS
tara:strand:+ start:50 stop:418 length:369 start_codon:yes stop_codon:yes gene_type:complete